MELNEILLIIDAQYDFINGTLAVEGAAEKMDKLAEYIRMHGGKYVAIVFTKDWHPASHCSFKENGGQWPAHFVEKTHGSDIYESVIKAATGLEHNNVYILTKGTNEDKEEYSIFKNAKSKDILEGIIKETGAEKITVCGIALDYCVKDTISDAIKLGYGPKLQLLKDFAPSIGDPETTYTFLEDENIKIITAA